MPTDDSTAKTARPDPARRQTGREKTARIPVKIEQPGVRLRKPKWIRARSPNLPEVIRLKELIASHGLHTVCQEASCPNIGECYAHGTATFMIMGDLCTRRCPFCDVAHGRPQPLDENEPANLARAVKLMRLRYVVVTSVDRDDLRDGGAAHFAACIAAVRASVPGITIEVLVPDFRGRMQRALDALAAAPPDVFNHNLETVPRLYRKARPGADYEWSLRLLSEFKAAHPRVPTKSGLMVGLGEAPQEIEAVMRDLRRHGCDLLTIGQYLQPSAHHLPVERFVTPEEFERYGEIGRAMGFRNVASGPLVRSSYHADRQAAGAAADD